MTIVVFLKTHYRFLRAKCKKKMHKKDAYIKTIWKEMYKVW